MGRMFRIITEGPIEAVTAGAALAHAENDPFITAGAPYIEVGGPAPIFHAAKTAKPHLLEQTPPPKAESDYLSVAFHQVAARQSGLHRTPIAPEIVAFHQPQHTVADEYRNLAADIRKQVGEGTPKSLLFAATARDRGTTTVLLNLAVTFGKQSDERVLIVDADFERAAAAAKLGLAAKPGLAEALNQSSPLAWAIQPTPLSNLQLLAAGQDVADANLADLPRVLTQLRKWFDWILVDGGVWGERPARDSQAHNFDALYLVTRQGDASASSLRTQIAQAGGLLRGFITTEK